MKNSDILKLEAIGEFPFTFYIEKAVPSNEDDELILEGVASTTNIDHDKERMSHEALRAMEAAINESGVPLRVEHQKEDLAIIGKVFKAWVDERNQLHIRARLDKNHPVSPILHNSMKNGVKMGLSVGGLVKRAIKEFSESAGGMIKTFYDVALQEVSVTPRPANYDSWLMAKSIAKDEKEAEEYSDHSGLRREFFLENSQLDYLKAFAKSIPDKAWRIDDSTKNINKDTKMTDEEKKESEETEKAVTRKEFNSLSKGFSELSQLVSKGFDNMVSIMGKAMDGDAMDTVNPDKKKPKDIGEEPAKKTMDDDAMDQHDPDKKKPKDESSAAKSETETEEEKKKSETETEEEKKKSSKEDETYDLETVNRSIGKMTQLQKRLDNLKKTETETETEEEKKKSETETEEDETKKAEDDEDKETTTKNSYHPLDVLIATMTKAMEDVVDNLEKKGQRILGFEREFISKNIVNNPEVQAELQKMIKIPGLKKSVVRGVAYMPTKDGRMIPLTPQAQQVEKSQDEKPKNFRDLYKTTYSSLSEQDNEE